MTFVQKLVSWTGVRPGEGRLVSLMMGQSFFLGIAFVFTQTASSALFLATFGAQRLPFAYLLIAVLVTLVATGYLQLSNRVPLPRLLIYNLLFFLVGSVVLRLSLGAGVTWPVFLLPFWFQTLVNLGNLAFWTLAGRLFDVRQGKRLFGFIGAGNWVANIIGGFVAAPIVLAIGTPNLLLLTAFAVLIAFAFLLPTLRLNPAALEATPEPMLNPQATVKPVGYVEEPLLAAYL